MEYYGWPIQSIENEHLRLDFLAQAGPRLVQLFLAGSEENLMAELPDLRWMTSHGEFYFHGGHRLWLSPEIPEITYLPDNAGLQVEPLSDGVRLTLPASPLCGVSKTVEVRLLPDRPGLQLCHILCNEGENPVEYAPWALTALKVGGWAVLPQQVGPVDALGLLPNRNWVYWPYTHFMDERLHWGDDYLFIHAGPQAEPVKVGYLNRLGWLGYFRKDLFFCKRFTPQPEKRHSDFGCNTEVYTKNTFIELETLGPLTLLDRGEATQHEETWEIHRLEAEIKSWEQARAVLQELKF